MNLNPATLWWLMAGVTVAIELLSGTFYLLMLAIGMAAGAVAAHMGLGLTMQIVVCAVVGASTVLVAYIKRRTRPGEPSARAERSVNLDVGETVFIDTWQPDGTAQVKYRGANWTAIHRPGVTPAVGAHRVAELVGNRLLVDPL